MAWRDVIQHKGKVGGVTQEQPLGQDPMSMSNPPPIPPTYAYTKPPFPRPLANLVYSGYPASNQQNAEWVKNNPNGMGVSEWQDSPDPVRQSNFVTAGRKIHPFGGDLTPLHTALWKALIMHDGFAAGKIHNVWRPQMYAGMQQPSVTRRNILPGQAQTFGSQYVQGGEPGLGPVQLASGLSSSGMDGDPYG
jgi:hypothetical protein